MFRYFAIYVDILFEGYFCQESYVSVSQRNGMYCMISLDTTFAPVNRFSKVSISSQAR